MLCEIASSFRLLLKCVCVIFFPSTMNAVLLSMVMVSAPVAESRIVQGTQCEADHECGMGMYCYESQLCTPCTNCNVYNRNKPPEYPLCPKSAQQCGQCLKGYVEEILTDGSRRDMCQPIISHTSTWFHPLIYTALIATFILICSGAVLYVRRKKGRNGSNYSSEGPRGDPPPYIEGNSPLIQNESTTEATITVGEVMETRRSFHCSKDRLNQQAIPYRNPEPPYGSGGEVDEPDLNGAVLDDNEDTVPSDWVPPLNYGDSSNSTTRSSSMVSLPEPFTDSENENEINNDDSGTSETGELRGPFGMFATSSSLPTVATQSEPAAACSTRSLDEEATYTQAPKRPRMTMDSGTASMDDVGGDNAEIGASLNLQVNVHADIHIVQNNVNIDAL